MNFQAYTLSKHPEWACLQVKAPESETRTPVHLCCVIDTSASMESYNKLENVKRSLHVDCQGVDVLTVNGCDEGAPEFIHDRDFGPVAFLLTILDDEKPFLDLLFGQPLDLYDEVTKDGASHHEVITELRKQIKELCLSG